MIIAAMAAIARTIPPAASSSKKLLTFCIAISTSFNKYNVLKMACLVQVIK